MENNIVVFWFRRDLRLEDNIGLQKALSSGHPVLPIFIFDSDILEHLSNAYDRRVDYIHQALTFINRQLQKHHSNLKTYYGKPIEVFKKITKQYQICAVYCNRDYEPQAIERDRAIGENLKTKRISFYDFKDQVIFEQSEISKTDLTPYTVYMPYAKKWKETLQPQHYAPVDTLFSNFLHQSFTEIHSLKEIGFQPTGIIINQPRLNADIINFYDKYRDFPALDNTSHLGMALRFGTISIRFCVSFALQHSETWLNELIWREFFMQILYHFPSVTVNSFKPKYDFIKWRNNETEFKLWCEGKTGYPIVDAGIRQLNQTGFMHNRVRMITANFLCKHLLIDWRWGEAYFAEKLNDFDLAANNGNWQWSAGCGCDAAPYFRIFNPTTQAQKFDKELQYIKTWNPDFQKVSKLPIVEHRYARERALKIYNQALRSDRTMSKLKKMKFKLG
jgi:deoxyribodipyrimidine photo-lyase